MDRDLHADQQAQREALSAMLDGDAVDADRACRAWRQNPQCRADWYVYHLIGEVMRSDETRGSPRHDAQFLDRLRERLAREPVLVAPASRAVHTPWARRAWAAPAAVAAGFLAVVGVVVVAGVGVEGKSLDRSAQAEGAARAKGVASLQPVSAAASAMPGAAADGVLIRDAELDRYLAAHKQYSGTSALAVPGGAVRNAAATAPGR